MPKPTRESLWRARIDLPENPYSDSDLECIVRAIEEGENCKLSPGDRKHLQNEVTMVARAFILATHCQSALNFDPLSASNTDPSCGREEVVQVVHRGDPRGFV